MEIIYAIYKENVIPLVGGVNPSEIEIGLAEYAGWKLCAMSTDDYDKFSEYKLYPITKSIAVGMTLIGRVQYRPNQAELDVPRPNISNEATNDALTEEEQELAKTVKEYLDKLELKFITRAKIRTFKDFEDDLSDTKLLVEFLLGYIAEDFSTKPEEEKNKYPIKDIMTSFVEKLSGSDLRINNERILNKVSQILKDESIIARIVKSNYIEQTRRYG